MPSNLDVRAPSKVVKFIGVYDADNTIVGELRYLFGKLFGTSSCALCDLTHGTKLKGRADFKTCVASLPVPVELFHRNDQPTIIRALTETNVPCIVAQRSDGTFTMAVEADELETCSKDVDKLGALLFALL